MPRLTRLYVKTALVYFVAAFLTGAVVAWRAWLPASIPWAVLTPLYYHLLMVGWVLHLIIGVAVWMFPRWSREQPRGPNWMGYGAYGALNVGLLLRVVAEPAFVASGASVWAGGLVVSALTQWLGGILVVALLWPRVRER